MPATITTARKFHELKLKPSKRLGLLFAMAYGCGFLALFLSTAPLAVKLLGAVSAAGFGYGQLRRHILLTHPLSILALKHTGVGWLCNFKGTGWQAVTLCAGSCCWPGFTCLQLAEQKRRFILYILPDSTDPDAFRLLRLFLRLAGPELEEEPLPASKAPLQPEKSSEKC